MQEAIRPGRDGKDMRENGSKESGVGKGSCMAGRAKCVMPFGRMTSSKQLFPKP